MILDNCPHCIAKHPRKHQQPVIMGGGSKCITPGCEEPKEEERVHCYDCLGRIKELREASLPSHYPKNPTV